ncbi:hypothetical protein ONZ45_g12089 [Pleurotus djamor]|nr:hypothetical protein ONZ45_g12089 [Pleurotus djamor]
MSLYFYEPFSDFDRLFDEAFNARASGQPRQRQVAANTVPPVLRPRMDLHEDSEKNLVTAAFEFPGLKKEDVHIDLHNGRLTVSAETSTSSEKNEDGYAVRERRFGKFARTLQLPQGIQEGDIKATMEDGVLSIAFPKSTPELAPKKITIS